MKRRFIPINPPPIPKFARKEEQGTVECVDLGSSSDSEPEEALPPSDCSDKPANDAPLKDEESTNSTDSEDESEEDVEEERRRIVNKIIKWGFDNGEELTMSLCPIQPNEQMIDGGLEQGSEKEDKNGKT